MRIVWLGRRRSLKHKPATASFSRRSVKSSRSLVIMWVIPCFIACRPASLHLGQHGIALFPQPFFDEEPCFLKLLGQLLGAEEMPEVTSEAIAGFIIPIEGRPSSQSHEQPF